MKIILLKDVAKVGQRGSVKEISDGYALNYLIPRGLAEQATPVKIAAHEAAQKKEDEARAHESETLKQVVQSLEGARITLSVRATEKGGLFKAISAVDVLREMQKERGVVIPAGILDIKSMKSVGEYPIKIKASGAEAHITVVIVASER